ncbi:MAG: hypothetical protein CSA62_03600 [Planctomycetota bacterium]|nr:MAG: hypothetical protein CSA62_03600 [Planctomycetota bacterium]
MIQINLLPEEFRRRERTSIKVFATVLAAVVVACCSVGYLGHVYFQEYRTIVSERESQQEKLRNIEGLAKYDDRLLAEIKEYEKRSKTIQQIANSRVLWTRLIDRFIDIVNNEGSTERHMCWFDSLKAGDTRGAAGPQVTLSAFSETASWKKQADFLDDLQNDELFFADFDRITAPGGAVIENEKREPAEAISFRLDLQMKNPKYWVANQPKKK